MVQKCKFRNRAHPEPQPLIKREPAELLLWAWHGKCPQISLHAGQRSFEIESVGSAVAFDDPVAGFDKAIPPGAEGKIIIKLNSKQCQSGDRKVSLVETNDPRAPRFTLVVQGKLKER